MLTEIFSSRSLCCATMLVLLLMLVWDRDNQARSAYIFSSALSMSLLMSPWDAATAA